MAGDGRGRTAMSGEKRKGALRLDLLSIGGVLLALLSVIGGQMFEGGSLGSLLQGAAALIVIGGTLAAVMLQSPLPAFLDGFRMLGWIVLPPPFDPRAVIAEMVGWAEEARRDGLLALEEQLAEVTDPFTRNGLQLLVDGFEPERIREALEVEMDAWEERYRAGAKIWESAGGYAPTIGILGAVLGLIHVMENLSDPNKLGGGIAVAFVATIYGVGSANLFFLPVASKLKSLVGAQVLRREMVREGLLALGNGENPKLIEARLSGYLA
jgi:chemotaxis protein MotA